MASLPLLFCAAKVEAASARFLLLALAMDALEEALKGLVLGGFAIAAAL